MESTKPALIPPFDREGFLNELAARLRAVPWSDLATVAGSAAHVPDAILGLMSAEPQVREKFHWQLDNHIVVQGGLFNSACFVVPFVIDILAARPDTDMHLIYDLLFEIANGDASPQETVVTAAGKREPLKAACRTAVLGGLDLYLRDVRDPRCVNRANALDLVELFDEAATVIVPVLQNIASREADAPFRRRLTITIAEIQPPPDSANLA